MDDALEELRLRGDELRRLAHEYWKLQEKATRSGAVKWITFTDGSVLIFTRGEYKDQLMSNIPPLGETLTYVTEEEDEDE